MSKGNEPAYPQVVDYLTTPETTIRLPLTGLTKREYFAGLAMQGMLVQESPNTSLIGLAVKMADALLKELEK